MKQTTCRALTLTAATVVFGVACASTPAPEQLSVDTAASIRSAQELDARDHPEAALHLELARRGYDDAKELMKDGENAAATKRLERAEADAELAIVLAKANTARREATRELDRVRELKEEAER